MRQFELHGSEVQCSGHVMSSSPGASRCPLPVARCPLLLLPRARSGSGSGVPLYVCTEYWNQEADQQTSSPATFVVAAVSIVSSSGPSDNRGNSDNSDNSDMGKSIASCLWHCADRCGLGVSLGHARALLRPRPQTRPRSSSRERWTLFATCAPLD